MPLDPLTLDSGETISCRHASIWPPVRAVALQESIEAQRMAGDITNQEYERLRTWERVCGLAAMDPEKCTTCPYAIDDEGKQYIDNPRRPLPYSTRKTTPS